MKTDDEKTFLNTLYDIAYKGRKLILVPPSTGNSVPTPSAEIRPMWTAGGYQYGIAEINYLGQRGSGLYTPDVEEAYLRAIDLEKRSPSSRWMIVINVEHTPYVDYTDYLVG